MRSLARAPHNFTSQAKRVLGSITANLCAEDFTHLLSLGAAQGIMWLMVFGPPVKMFAHAWPTPSVNNDALIRNNGFG